MYLFFIVQTRATTNIVTSVADAGPGSLRQMIAEAHSGDTLAFSVTGTITLTSGELVLETDMSIVGPGTTNLTISGNHGSRIFKVNSGVAAWITGLTIRDGKAPDGADGQVLDFFQTTPGETGEPGGAIYNSGMLTLQDCRISSSAAGRGGNGTQLYDGGNPSAGGSGGLGGGVYNAGSLTLSYCVVEGNSAGDGGVSGAFTFSPMSGSGGSGGGIYSVGTLRVDDSIIGGNRAGNGGNTPLQLGGAGGGDGGGVFSDGTFVANRSIFTNNVAGHGGHGGGDELGAGAGGGGGSGGAISAGGNLSMTKCTVSRNSAGRGGDGGGSSYGSGGAGGSGGDGGGIAVTASALLIDCKIDNNTSGHGGFGGFGYIVWPEDGGVPAPDGAHGNGGGLSCGITNVVVKNSILADNSAAGGGGVFGGELNNCTLTGNSAWSFGGGSCGGTLNNCIVYFNLAPTGPDYFSGILNYCCTSPIPTNGLGNITNEPVFVHYADGDLHLQSTSPCINAGNNEYVSSTTDLDGNPRIVGTTVDMGAYEFQGAASVTVTNCTEAALRAAITAGGTVMLVCDGVITLADTIVITNDTVLDGTGHAITISGNGAVRVLHVTTNVTFTVINLRIADGCSENGGGVFNDGGTVNLRGAVLDGNTACAAVGWPLEEFSGGGLFNRGSVNATNCQFSGNRAYAPWMTAFPARGGAVRNVGGTVSLHHCSLMSNSVAGGGNEFEATEGAGGAIYNSGCLVVTESAFVGNSAHGGDGTEGPPYPYVGQSGSSASGGAICNVGSAVITASHISGNSASGGTGCSTSWADPTTYAGFDGGSGGSANGGAVFNSGTASLVACWIVTNSASGGAGGNGAPGEAWIITPLETYHPGGSGGDGGAANGAALFNQGIMEAVDCSIAHNVATGQAGGRGIWGSTGGSGGTGGGAYGALFNSGKLALVRCTLSENTASAGTGGEAGDGVASGGGGSVNPFCIPGSGGAGGTGGTASGTAVNWGTLTLTNSTVGLNTAVAGSGTRGGEGSDLRWTTEGVGGNGGAGGNGGSAVGGLSGSGVTLSSCTLAWNSGVAGAGGSGGAGGFPSGIAGTPGGNGTAGGGLCIQGFLVNSLLGTNVPVNACCCGLITDLGHNLSSDSSCAFTNAGSLNNTDPKLGPLADYGGPTLTMALLPGSPAIDAGDTAAAPPTDQRGQPRPYKLVADIGAYEYQGAYAEWLLSYGLPTDGSVDDRDTDGDGLNTWQEWRCRTCPTNALSVLRLLSAVPAASRVTVTWLSESGVTYFLERSTNLASSPFTPLAANIAGEPGVTTYTDSNTAGMGPSFYRVGVGE